MSLPTLRGERLCLRPLCIEDAEGNYPHWLNDPQVTQYNSHGEVIYTKGMAKEYIASVEGSATAHVFAIVEHGSNRHIGNVSLQAINAKARSAEFAILIGEPDVYGKGVGYEAGRLLLRYGFETLNLHRIYCGTSSDNISMQKLALKLGMTYEGRRRDAIFKNGKFVDIIEYGILVREYEEKDYDKTTCR